ncbi:MAG TPA: DUF2283 domain-containing protein [Thioploca sp.]|nr:DUF2283 domain-containing protein [Thioploca sp.]
MKLTYDPRYNIAYLSLYEKTEQVETICISDELHIDMAPNGTVYGIELLNANQQLFAEPQNQFVVINEALNNRQAISLA